MGKPYQLACRDYSCAIEQQLRDPLVKIDRTGS
jgi:hypothetical protein